MPYFFYSNNSFNPRTYGGGEGAGFHPTKVFLSFFLEDKTSAPDVSSSCLFILWAHFETSLVMVSCYGYEIDVISSRWSSHFCVKIHVFSTSFNNKGNLVAKILQSSYLGDIFHVKHKNYHQKTSENIIE